MKVISFDIGIKNMAFCILSTPSDSGSRSICINEWNVLNLMNEEPPSNVQSCSCIMPAKTKKAVPKVCGKKSKYHKNGTYFCDKHAKVATQFLLPTKQRTITHLKKLKVDELTKLCQSYFLNTNIENLEKQKKPELIDLMHKFYVERCLEPIVSKKTKTANETDLVCIGKSMKRMLNVVPGIDEITHVVIENQISPIANRMKTIQGMLAQYFIMKNENIHIEFVSSINKLKQFKDVLPKPAQTETAPTDNRTNPNYKEHKRDGVFYCSEMLEANPSLVGWREVLNTKKKDDLADCFLQGIWYLKHNKILLYADDLKINVIS